MYLTEPTQESCLMHLLPWLILICYSKTVTVRKMALLTSVKSCQ